MKKIKLNPKNLNLRKLCYYYPCHQGIPDSEYDCRTCYCPFYEECSRLELTELGGYWYYYRDRSGVERRVWACEKCTILHHRTIFKRVQKWRKQGYSDLRILQTLSRYMQRKGRV
ncbi:MAG TPA: hypothetical protein GX739_04335 [Firmicutes bacterium]|nr:hypothetical protein [Bacillota bacterium]